jgi:hypothetical protein
MSDAYIAFAEEAPRDGHPQAWHISLVDLITRATVRTFDTDRDVFSLGLSGENIAYTEGFFDSTYDHNKPFDTRLMLSSPGNETAVEVAADAYDVSFSGDRMAWVNDPQTSQHDATAAPATYMTATTSERSPRPLAVSSGRPLDEPVAAGDLVSWIDDGDLFISKPDAGTTSRLSGTGRVDQASARGGFLTWLTSNSDGSQSIKVISSDELFPPPPTPIPTPSARATPIVQASLAPPESIAVNGISWARSEHDALPEARYIGSVTVTGGRFLMTASRCAYPLPEYAGGCGTAQVVFSSADGVAWNELGTVAIEPDGVGTVYEFQNQLLASGSRGEDTSAESGIWRSVDGGLNWDFIADPVLPAGSCAGDSVAYVDRIVSIGGDLIGVGLGRVWHSNDGVSWDCVGLTPARIQIDYANGVFVGEGETDPAAADWFWRSGDGIDWQKTQKAPLNTQIVSVADGFVALGGGDKYLPPTDLLTSPDGASWTKRPYPFGDADVRLAESEGDRALVIENDYSSIAGEVEPGAIWISSNDGATWTRYQLPPRNGDYADSAAILGNRIVATGSSYNGGNSDGSGVIWTAEFP